MSEKKFTEMSDDERLEFLKKRKEILLHQKTQLSERLDNVSHLSDYARTVSEDMDKIAIEIDEITRQILVLEQKFHKDLLEPL